jgi:FG-GAP-like repeat
MLATYQDSEVVVERRREAGAQITFDRRQGGLPGVYQNPAQVRYLGVEGRIVPVEAIPSILPFAFYLLLLFTPAVSKAQRAALPQFISARALENSSVFPKPSHKLERFLGWHYAAAAHQDTTQWKREVDTPALAKNSAAGSSSRELPALGVHALSGSSAPASSIAGFASATALLTGFIPTAVVQGDFNGDGKLDLAISNGGDNTIYVLLGNGDGTFAVPEILYTQGQSPVWLAAAQLRTNGHLDLIAVDGDTDQVEVFTGNGDGTFQPGAIVAKLTQTPTFVLAGDFNNDGNMDLAVGLAVDPDASEPQFEILLGNGSGSFPTTVAPPPVSNGDDSPLPTGWLALGDLNNDGWLDVVTTVEFTGAIAYLNQNGSAFLQGSIFGPQDAPVTVALGDMNGDGCLDAVEAGGYGLLTIATGNCDGTFTQTTPVAELGDVDVAMVIADVNGDGNPDIVASSAYSDAEEEGGLGDFGGYLVSVLDGDGKGDVAPAVIYRVASQAYSLAVADLSGDQRPDIITVSEHENQASELFNDMSGGFGSPSGEAIGYVPTASGAITNAPNPVSVPQAQTIDVNGDGKPDVVVMEYGYLATQPPQIAVLLNDGTGKLGPPIRSPISVGPKVPYPIFVMGNFRNLNTPDIIYASANGQNPIAFIPGNGDGTFGTPVVLTTQLYPLLLVSGDFNGDGNLDFAVLGYVPAGAGDSPQLDVFLGNGNGTFNHLPSQILTSLTNVELSQLIAADFNHDGKLDLLIGYVTDNGAVGSPYNLDLAFGNGDGTFQMPSLAMSNFGWATVADVNKDGYPDLIQEFDPNPTLAEAAIGGLDGYQVAAITIYLGGAGGQFQQGGSYFAPGILADQPIVGDFNGDGNVDVALPYFSTDSGRPWEERIQTFQGVGDGTFLPVGDFYQLPDYDHPMAGGDYRGLGVTDLLDLVGSTSSINTISASPASALIITPDNSPLTSSNGSATVTLALPASSSEVVQLTSSDPAVSLPSSVAFTAGQTQQSFSFTLGSGFDKTHVLALSAQLNGQTAVAYIPMANPNATPGVYAQAGYNGAPPIGITPGESPTFMFFLESLGGYSGVFGSFTCSGLPAAATCEFASPSVSLSAGGLAENGVSLIVPAGAQLGTYSVNISASNGAITPSATLQLGVGDFDLSVNPNIVSMDTSNSPYTTVSTTFLDGLDEEVSFSCTGLPSGASCSIPGIAYPGVSVTAIGLSLSPVSNLAPADYPFQIVGTANVVSHSVSATLRISGFTGSLNSNSAAIAGGGSAKFNVTFTSVNHFTSSDITLFCSNVPGVTCTYSPSLVTLTDGGTATAQLVLTYVAPATAAAGSRPFASKRVQALACLIVFVLPWGVRRRSWKGILCIFVCLVLFFTISGCGGGGGGGGSSQTLDVSVAAQAPIYSGTLEENVGTISLTVQQ